jgi:hypothetical protein
MNSAVPDFLPVPNLDWEGNASLIGRANRAVSRYDGLLQRKTLSELLAATPEGLNRVDGWDEMPQTGMEL